MYVCHAAVFLDGQEGRIFDKMQPDGSSPHARRETGGGYIKTTTYSLFFFF